MQGLIFTFSIFFICAFSLIGCASYHHPEKDSGKAASLVIPEGDTDAPTIKQDSKK